VSGFHLCLNTEIINQLEGRSSQGPIPDQVKNIIQATATATAERFVTVGPQIGTKRQS
jgi:hypothetical protein